VDYFRIEGGTRLRGSVGTSGAKNAALPIMAACILCQGEVILRDVPDLADIRLMVKLLERLGVKAWRDSGTGQMHLVVQDETSTHAEYELVRQMRASVCVMGPLLAKRKTARVSMPGGCAIGDRPIDLHVMGMAALGGRVDLVGGDILVKAERGLTGAELFLAGPFGPTVLGTANVMMAACLARGTTLIESAACEPEVVDLANFLNACGAKVTGQGTHRIRIDGVESLHGCDYQIIPDRIEAGTFMLAAAISNGEIEIRNCRLNDMLAVVDRLRRTGVNVDKAGDGTCVVSSSRRLEPTPIVTLPFPGFPTDLQAQMMALLCLADGNSMVTERVFPDRFMHVGELSRMGARLHREGPTVIVEGVKWLVGAPVMASDLRASAALLLGGLVADGVTSVSRVYHIDRGYEHIEQKLSAVGAKIQRLQEERGAQVG
jgi:UDP-N-acetylglucosamine 1-carboxyvinyltransferase